MTFSGLLLIATIVDLLVLPKRLNTGSLGNEAQSGQESEKPIISISFKLFIFNRRSFFAIISSMFAMVFMLFANSILSVQLEKMGVPDKNIGFIIALGALTYAVTSPLIGVIFKRIATRYITFLAFLISVIALFMFGPSKLLGFP